MIREKCRIVSDDLSACRTDFSYLMKTDMTEDKALLVYDVRYGVYRVANDV